MRDARRLLGVGPGASRPAILKAWREAVRANHPDAAPEAERRRAEALCSRINAAKDMLLLHPAGTPPATSRGGSDETPTSAARPAPGGDGNGAQPARSGGAGTAPDRVPTGVRPADATAPPRTAMLLTFLVAGTLGLLSILAITSRDDDSSQSSRIETATTPLSVAALTPEQEMAALLTGSQPDAGVRGQLTTPATSLTDLDDIVKRLSRADPGTRAEARANVVCSRFQPGAADRVACKVASPEGILPYPVEFRRDDQGWHLYGYRRGG